MLSLLLACTTASAPTTDSPVSAVDTTSTDSADVLADVTAVSATGSEGSWTFAVTILSPDTGCEQYADWWEVLSADGALVYRRILNHSHVDEQPFTRTGSPVEVSGADEVIVRAHLNPGGYGGAAMRGSVSAGFSQVTLAADFAAGVEDEAPQPEGCLF